MCFVCGVENGAGLCSRFLEVDGDELVGVFQPKQEHQGYPGRLHGGIASALLDETIGRSIMVTEPDVWGVTVELQVRFKKPVPLDREIRAIGRITAVNGRAFEGTGEIRLEDGTVAVEAWGKYVRMPLERIAGEVDEGMLVADVRPLPDEVDA